MFLVGLHTKLDLTNSLISAIKIKMSNKTFIYDIVEKFYITFKLLLEENLLP